MITRGEYFKRNGYTLRICLFIVGALAALTYGLYDRHSGSMFVALGCMLMAVGTFLLGQRAYYKLQDTEERTNTKFK